MAPTLPKGPSRIDAACAVTGGLRAKRAADHLPVRYRARRFQAPAPLAVARQREARLATPKAVSL